MHGASSNKQTREDSRKLLDWIYGKIPDTKGCMENIAKPEAEGGCGAWCCKEQNPQVLYVEFLNAWNHVTHTWKKEPFLSLVERSLRAYLFDAERRGCVFWDRESKLCSIHKHRPFNCRVYGVTPEEEFKPRYERLKVIYPDTRDQCNLVSTVNDEPVTKKQIDEWWKLINNAEKSLGISPKKINDSFGGTYRTFYEHILLETMGEEGMEMLSNTRLVGSTEEKEAIAQKALSGLRSILDAAVQGKSNNG
jgi:Fe-S-cluster containining protein